MSNTNEKRPYDDLNDQQWWRYSVADVKSSEINPASISDWKITKETKIATAGSCFAVELSSALKKQGYNYYVVENGPEGLDPVNRKAYSYGDFSARYGMIYTSRQLVQMFDRAYGEFEPQDHIWKSDSGFHDAFRPHIQPQGFVSEAELLHDRRSHYRHLRELFENLDVFVFTLGLTESWRSKKDKAVYPVCPGYGAGNFSSENYEFHNMDVDEVFKDIEGFYQRLKSVNPNSKMLLTVSPVPLIATVENHHVLKSTFYSKSCLRVAADKAASLLADVTYFPSYEIILGTFQSDRYFEDDRRSVTRTGVDHVMRCFFAAFCEQAYDPKAEEHRVYQSQMDNDIAEAIKKACDEEWLAQALED